LMPREIECNRVTFKYGLGTDFINWLKTFAYLGLDAAEKIQVGDVRVAPRDVLAAVLPNPAKLGHLMPAKRVLVLGSKAPKMASHARCICITSSIISKQWGIGVVRQCCGKPPFVQWLLLN